MTLRVVIADDEPVARRGLRHMLLEQPDVAVVGEARNGREAVQLVCTLAPDLLLLDVQMPTWDGFDVIRRLDPPLPYVVFVTAHDEYAVRAFETHALDYRTRVVATYGVMTAGKCRGKWAPPPENALRGAPPRRLQAGVLASSASSCVPHAPYGKRPPLLSIFVTPERRLPLAEIVEPCSR